MLLILNNSCKLTELGRTPIGLLPQNKDRTFATASLFCAEDGRYCTIVSGK
jgi:hypothetical protein